MSGAVPHLNGSLLVYQQGCKIQLARTHWRVNLGFGRVEFTISTLIAGSLSSCGQ